MGNQLTRVGLEAGIPGASRFEGRGKVPPGLPMSTTKEPGRSTHCATIATESCARAP